MMTNSERVAYIRGLFEGLDVNVDKKEGRILREIIGLLEDISHSIAELEEENEALQQMVDVIIEDIYDDDDSYDEDDSDDDESELFIVCPNCEEQIFISEEMLEEGNISCPACGEEIQFDLSALNALAEGEDDDEEVPF